MSVEGATIQDFNAEGPMERVVFSTNVKKANKLRGENITITTYHHKVTKNVSHVLKTYLIASSRFFT